MNRSGSLRNKKFGGFGSSSNGSGGHKRFSFASLRNTPRRADLSAAMYTLIKTENTVVNAYEAAAHAMQSVAQQLSEWGANAEDDHLSDISDKLGVLITELAEVEENFASEIEESRVTLKQIRNTEASVQPSRDNRQKLIDQIHALKGKEPQSPKLVELEQHLVRAEAESLVAEAQLTNIQRHALKETYLLHFAAVIERSEKSLILADHGRRILELLDDTPVVPGDQPAEYRNEAAAKQVLLDAESDLQAWQPKPYNAGGSKLAPNLLPTEDSTNTAPASTTGAESQLAAPVDRS
ncbi:hypothetical protein PYCC9005_004755 [Savitreella phatthalungensis]